MNPPTFGGKPTVLRCNRCGKFVDWEDARLQVICGCRPRVDLPPVFVREATPQELPAARELIQRDFGHTDIVAFGEVMNIDGVPALVAQMQGELAGALVFRRVNGAVHIVALATDPMWQRSGVGGHLVAEIELAARREGRTRVIVATTNDNLPSLYFYQRRGYRITEIVPNALTSHLKTPEAPGFGGIPIRDEIRLEKKLS